MRPRAATAVTLVAALGLTACGGGGGTTALGRSTPQQIVAAATRAVASLHSVRVSGSVTDGAAAHDAIRLDLHLLAGRGAVGSLVQNGLSFRLVTVGRTAYVNGSPAFWRQFAGPTAAKRLRGRWLRAPAARGAFSSFHALTDLHALLTGLLGGHGALVRGAPATIDGRRALVLRDPSRHGTLYVAASGPPYPLRIVTTGAGGGHLEFTAFDAPVPLRVPAGSVALSALQQ